MIRSNNWLRKVCDKLGTFGGRKLPLVRTRLNIELLEDRIVPSGTTPTAVADYFNVHQGQTLVADPLLNDTDPEGKAMLWFNLLGLLLAACLFGAFFWLYGSELFGFVMLFIGDEPIWPQ